MKSILAAALIALALSLCNLMSRFSRQSNSNGTTTANTSAPASSENKSGTLEGPPPPGLPTPVPVRAPISGGVLNGKAVSLPQPAYPAVARAAHASGQVVVQVTVDEEGQVIDAHAVSGHPLLQQSAVQAARSAKFAPTKLSGQPVKVTGTLIYNFVAR